MAKRDDFTPEEIEDAKELVAEWKAADRLIDEQTLRLLPLMAGGCVAAVLSGKLDPLPAGLFLGAAVSFSLAILAVLGRVRIRVWYFAVNSKRDEETAHRMESLVGSVFFLITAIGLALALYGTGVQMKGGGTKAPSLSNIGR